MYGPPTGVYSPVYGPYMTAKHTSQGGIFTSNKLARGPVVLRVNLPRKGARVRPPTGVYSPVYGPYMTAKHTPITALTTVCPSASTPPAYKPAEQSVTDNHARRLSRMSAQDNHSRCPLRMSAPDTGVFSNRPGDRPGLGETSYETYLSFPCVGYILVYRCRIRAGLPSILRRFFLL